ncbi:activator of 90 kDa heat shock protein ATPase homolog 1-like [Liolophura sinensis]|uniref:activator of 90 kDa heat shock protein ATPase homolog 1-like n=1 Tax=Liolophura sinensis TaxID=3198878 RepID=UPI003158C796
MFVPATRCTQQQTSSDVFSRNTRVVDQIFILCFPNSATFRVLVKCFPQKITTMAKWGEGDPRWIVEERPDATNVNNWHWVEKDATGWSKEKLKELLLGLVVEDETAFCEIKETSKLEGEASANNRKAKLIFFYEWVIKLDWSGHLKAVGDQSQGKKVKGKLEILNLSEEHDPEHVDIEVTTDKNTDEAYKVKEVMRKCGTDVIRKQLKQYVKELRERYSQGIILPTKDGKSAAKEEPKSSTVNKAKQEMNKVINGSSISQSLSLGVKIRTKKLETKEMFECRPTDVYRALTDLQMVKAYCGGESTIEAEKGGRFSLFSGNITGEFVELVPEEKIVTRWRCKSWPEEHYSDVKIHLHDKDGSTELSLSQTGIPESEYEKTLIGWKQNYWERMKSCFGFGARLF